MRDVAGIPRRQAPFWDWGSTTGWAALRCTTEKSPCCRRSVMCQHPALHLRLAVLVRENSPPKPDLLEGSLDPGQAMKAMEIEMALADCIRQGGRTHFAYSTANDCFSRKSVLRPATIPACRGVAQPGSASGLGPEGRRFESFRPDH